MEFGKLLERFSPNIKSLISKTTYLPQFIDKNDLFQEITIHLFERWKRGELEEKTDSYIIISCYFHLKNYLRKHKEKAKIISLNEPVGERGDTLEDLIPDKKPLFDEKIDDAIFIQKLTLTQREHDVARFLGEGYTLRDIGKKLGISHVMVLKIKEKIKGKFLSQCHHPSKF